MATVAIIPSALGARRGVHDAAELIGSRGHDAVVVDLLEGRLFNEHELAALHIEDVGGLPALMRAAWQATSALPDPLVLVGFSIGGALAELIAANRPVSGVVVISGALDPAAMGARWPAGVPVQVHGTVGDPFRSQEAIDGLVAAVRAAGGEVEVFDYPGVGHLFTDPSRSEYQASEAELVWTRVLELLDRVTRQQPTS